jgi:hypothetical protein
MMQAFPAKDPGETITYTFDFSDVLADGETIASATISIRTVTGTDATPAALLSGAHQLVTPQVMQMITGGVSGVTYSLKATVTTSGNHVFVSAAPVPVLSVG